MSFLHPRGTSPFFGLVGSIVALVTIASCGDERPAPADTCEVDSDCLSGQICVLQHCATQRRDMGATPPPPDGDAATGMDGATDPDTGPPDDPDMGVDMGPPRICGDTRIDFPEDCDPPNPATCEMRIGCSDMCAIDVIREECGNGCPDPGEECGDVGGGSCEGSADCIDCRCVERCGNGMLDPDETCGEPGAADCAMGMLCRECTCYMPSCGNTIVDEGEECNEPGLTCGAGESCVDCQCVSAGCGNGIADMGEECGEPAFPDCPLNHSCDDCVCVRIPMCGDGSLDPGEECETTGPLCGAGESCVGCACVRTCGDGTADVGELCGEPGLPSCEPGSSCLDCACEGRCGNGAAELGEKCGEPGLSCAAGARCDTASCQCEALCGNGIVDAGETCDPPTMASPLCSEPNVCNSFCQLAERPRVCGNGCADPGEQCLEGPMSACPVSQTCRDCRCLPETCGDGVVNASGEVCDGAAMGTAVCPDAPGGGVGGGTVGCLPDCTPDISQCRCGHTVHTIAGTLLPIRRRDVYEIQGLNGTRVTYRVDTVGARGFDPVACVSTTPSSADCISRSDDAFPCTGDSACGQTGCPQGNANLPGDPDGRYYIIVESHACTSCFAQDVGEYTLTISTSAPICVPTVATENDVCMGSGLVVAGQETCVCP
ncbi:MAG: hypothetical protein IT379_27250 [Deltaproteobacteria bacterium]|nr:hypothetical protein [Deltaproteobacteria bacterium]